MRTKHKKQSSGWREISILVFLSVGVFFLFYKQITMSPFPFKIKPYGDNYNPPTEPAATSSSKGAADKKQYQTINFELLSNFDYRVAELETAGHPGTGRDLKSEIPKAVTSLDQKDVAITGFLLPIDYDGEGKYQTFIMMKAIPGCLFCQIPKANGWIVISFDASRGVFFRPDQAVTIYGHLEVGEERKDGVFESLYRIKADDLKVFK